MRAMILCVCISVSVRASVGNKKAISVLRCRSVVCACRQTCGPPCQLRSTIRECGLYAYGFLNELACERFLRLRDCMLAVYLCMCECVCVWRRERRG